MLPSMKFYVVSIVAIFTALGLGIYIGFAMDTEDFITERQEGLIEIVESNFETITEENQNLISINEKLEANEKNKNEFIDSSYNYILPERLSGFNIAIIESNSDYVISGIGRDLEFAGANLSNITTINNKLIKENMDKKLINNIMSNIVYGGNQEELIKLEEEGYIDILGNYSDKIDIIIIAGGSFNKNSSDTSIDKNIIDFCKKENIQILGVEKSISEKSYIGKYKEYNISTIDNVETKIGKIAMILSLQGKGGHFGIKGTAESILPIK